MLHIHEVTVRSKDHVNIEEVFSRETRSKLIRYIGWLHGKSSNPFEASRVPSPSHRIITDQ